MAFDHYFSHGWTRQIPATMTNSEKFQPCFDCNICLDFASEPVVTLCGHLYCWPCIYNWLHVQTASLDPDEPPQCPVCKAGISHTTMIPLYGRGQSAEDVEADAKALRVPPRPSAFGNEALATITSSNDDSAQLLTYGDLYENQNFEFDMYDSYDEEDSSSSLYNNLEHTPTGRFRDPTSGVFGETVYDRFFGNSENEYAHSNSYALTGSSSSSRSRRREMVAEKSLNRIFVFLLCCIVLCLVFF